MPNPFGITEVDVPGLLNAYEGQQSNRIQRMVTRQQLAALERQADRDLEEQATIARITGGAGKGNGATGAYAPQQPNVGQQVANGIMGAAGVQPPAAPVQPATQGAPRFTPEQLLELRLSGPRGAQMAEAFQNMNQEQLALTARRANAGLQVANGLLGIPEAQRGAVFQQNAQLLLAQGFTPQELQALAAEGFSDDVLRQHAQGASLAARFAAPSYRNVEGEVIDERLLGTGQDPAVYRSQFISTPQGLAERPGGRGFGASTPSAPPQVGEVRRGYRYNGGDPASPQSWTPEGAAPTATRTGSADLDNWNNAGRAGPQGPRTFR